MLETFELQNLNKLVEGEVRYFPSPQFLHTRYIQRFKCKRIKASTEVGSQFPMPIQALSTDLAIQYRQCPDRTPPVIRTFFLTRKAFIELAELFQGLLQELRRLYLLTCAECQICVLHSEVCPNALTCRWHRFGRSIVCCDTKVVVSTRITFYRDLLNSTFPITVFVKCERDGVS